MPALLDKLAHFAMGIATGVVFWWVLERNHRNAAATINPICFLVMVIWGASGLFFFRKLGVPLLSGTFFFRKLGVPLLSGTFFYMAFPDWDIPLYNATGLRFLIHRSWLFHSVLIPMGGLGGWLWFAPRLALTTWQKTVVNLLRDGAMGLSVGVSAHLIWDALLSSTRRGFYIHGFSGLASYGWLLLNLVIGLGVPLVIAWSLGQSGRAIAD